MDFHQHRNLKIKKMKKSSNQTLISALEILSNDIVSEDGIANSAIREAAERIELLSAALDQIIYADDQSYDFCFKVVQETINEINSE